MKIAMLGTRGVPASYSGFETCVEQLGKRLVKRGHEVTVYCRRHHVQYEGDTYEGMRLVKLPTIQNKYLDTIVHTTLSTFHATTRRFDIGMYFIAGNSPLTIFPRIVGTKTILNVDGLDWKRDKWPPIAKQYIKFAEYLATKFPNAYLTDSHVVQEYYQDSFKSTPLYIPYGSEVKHLPPGETLDKFGLKAGEYILFVGRLVPENCAHHLIEAFKELDTDRQCVIVGDAYYEDRYIKNLRDMAADDPRIIFTGYVFGDGYHEISNNAHIFVETSAVGGTHPALVEAMAFESCVVAQDTPANLETIDDAGFSYDGTVGAESLKAVLQRLLADPALVEEYKKKARARAEAVYTWDGVTDAYERLFLKVLGREGRD